MMSISNFSDVAVDHAMNPRNCRALASYNGYAKITGPCGDTMKFWLSVEDGKIDAIAFDTDGCGSSVACGSIATELAQSKTLKAARGIRQHDILAALGEFPEQSQHCALLAATTLCSACNNFLANRRNEKWKNFARRVFQHIGGLFGKQGRGKDT